MDSLNDPIKILARRFVLLPPQIRMKVAGRLLRWREDEESASSPVRRSGKRSFLARFWAEVEAAHGDRLYPVNPFAEEKPEMLLCGVEIVRNNLMCIFRASFSIGEVST